MKEDLFLMRHAIYFNQIFLFYNLQFKYLKSAFVIYLNINYFNSLQKIRKYITRHIDVKYYSFQTKIRGNKEYNYTMYIPLIDNN